MDGDASRRLRPEQNPRRRRNRRSKPASGGSSCWSRSLCGRLPPSSLLLAGATFLLTGLPSVASWSTSSVPEESGASRRSVFQRIAVVGLGTVPATIACSPSTLSRPAPAFAKNLPDPISIDASKTGTAETLQPILNLEAALKDLLAEISQVAAEQTQPLDAIVESLTEVTKQTTTTTSIPTTEQEFKSIFDAFSDPVSYKQKFVDQNAFLVYYTRGFDGPGRPSIESDLPVRQTLQYGTRNDAWVAWEAFCVERDFQRRHPEDGADARELQRLLQNVANAVDSYLKVSGVR